MWRKVLLAFLAALLGLATGALTASLMGTIKLLLSPGIEHSSYEAFLVAPLLLFLEGLLWSIVGGAMFVLPPGFLLLAGYALTLGPEQMKSRRTRRFALAFAAVLYAPVLFFGFRTRPMDGLHLAVPIVAGVWTSLTFLNRRLRSPSAA